MYKHFVYGMAAFTLASIGASAQDLQRRASMVGGGGGAGNGGRCTVEVVVDSIAEVHINGDTATLHNVAGQAPQWRRFECTGRMPSNAGGIQFRGIDGRGHQELVSDPRNNGPIVVRIEDPQGGAEAYTFEIVWGSSQGYDRNYPQQNGGQPYPQNANPGYDPRYRVDPRSGNDPRYGQGRPGEPGYDRGNRGFSASQALDVCQQEVQRRAAARFGTQAIEFADVRADDNPDRADWITGRFFLRRDRDRDQAHQFACSVNFDTGRVRSVEIDPTNRDRYSNGASNRTGMNDAVQTCQREVERRARERGYRDVEFGEINVDDRPGRNDWVIGNLRAGRDSFTFSCQVDLGDGDVRSVDLRRR